ncbi:hypothetical protein Bphyt_3614 [Paraburkholderia phytofirmans PsJN]|uniref:Uncharacterized protein n=1 Tax=Paraburkholderia phytofirmans (strain DSM 17436 / LMG 22146 / PsJN) TaxID=398527 RepID=B2T721_PARPJ|nr:hypothetical protein Bphyt_3614 [Paraburkholderia phytofirmans PsJN]
MQLGVAREAQRPQLNVERKPIMTETDQPRTLEQKNGGTTHKSSSVHYNTRVAPQGGSSSHFCERKIRAASNAK